MVSHLLLLTPTPALPSLDLKCELEPSRPAMHISAMLTFTAPAQPASKGVFFLSDRMEAPTVRIIEPADLAGAVEAKPASTRDHDVTYEIALPRQTKPSERFVMEFVYSSKDAKGFVYLLSPDTCFAGGYNTLWFPSVGSTRRMLGRLEFKTPASIIVKASGKELQSEQEGGVRKTTFAIEQPTVPTFAAGKYHVTKLAGTVPLTIYELKNRSVSQEYARKCSSILDQLSREFGPYPFPDFAIVETPSPVSSEELGFSGASFEGFMFADSNSLDSGFNTAYYGHEIGHQWWGNLVQLSGAKGAYMLSEAMAQFGSLQCVQKVDGPLLAAQYRYSGYPEYSAQQCAMGAIPYSVTDADMPLAHLPSGYDVVYHQLANSKGFLVWDSIARQLGRDRFRKALQAVTRKYAWREVTFDEFLTEVRTACGVGAPPVLEQWLERKGAPVVWTEWEQKGNRLVVTLRQTSPVYMLRMPLVLEFGNGSRTVREVDLHEERQTISIPVSQRVDRVELDPRWEVFHSTPALQDRAKAMKDCTLGIFARLRGDDPLAIKMWTTGLTRLPKPDPWGVEYRLRTYLGGALYRAKKFEQAREQLEAAVACPVREALELPWTYYNLARTYKELKQEAKFRTAVDLATSAEAALPYPTGVLSALKAIGG